MKGLLLVAKLLIGTTALCQTSYFEDFSDGMAQDWSSDQGIWAVENFYYHGVGQLVNNRWLNVAYVQTFGGQDVSIEADMRTDAGFDNVNKMIVARYQDPNNFLFLNFVAADRNFFVVEQVVNGVRTRILPEFTYHLPHHHQTEWKHCRVDIDGKRVFAYFEGDEVFNAEIQQVLVRQGVVGAMTFSSPGGGNEELFLDDYRAGYFDYAPVSEFEVNPGQIYGEHRNAILEPDNMPLVIRPGPVFGGVPPARLTLRSTTSILNPTEFRFKLTSGAASVNIVEAAYLMNFQSNSLELIHEASGTLANTRKELVFTSNPTRFISPVDGEIVAVVTYRAVGPTFSHPWSARVDYVGFTSRN